MRRILAVSTRWPPYGGGGYELLAADAVRALRARGHAVDVLCGAGAGLEREPGVLPWLEPAIDRGDLFRRSFDASNAERFRLHFLNLANYRATLRALDARGAPAELVLFFNLAHASLAPLLAARHAGVPTLGYVADPWLENHWVRAWRERGDKPARLAALERLWRTFRDLVGVGPLLACSRWMRAALIADGLPADSVAVVPLGVSPALARRAEAARPAARAPGEPLRVACVSSLWSGKGQHVLLKAAARARMRGAPVEVDLAGDGDPDYGAYLRELAAALALDGAVRFHGRLAPEEVASLYERSHALALPSTWPEPFGLATAEGLAFGLCTVASDAGASPELVDHGETGWIAAAGDPKAWADALSRLCDDEPLRARLAAAGRARARTELDHARFVEALEAACERAAGKAA